MTRHKTTNKNAELAAVMYAELLEQNGWGLSQAWLAIFQLLVSCQVYEGRRWVPLHGAPVLMERNNYGFMASGEPNKYLREALAVGQFVAEELDVPEAELCAAIGLYFRHPSISGLQPNNPRGHAFRTLVAETLSRFGDPALDVYEEQAPRDWFPGFKFQGRSKNPKIDILAARGNVPVAIISTRWTYRHDRVDLIDEAREYMPAARRVNPSCKFFGVTGEFGEARLKKVIQVTTPMAGADRAMDRFVHLNPALCSSVIGHNAELKHLWGLPEFVNASADWR